MTGFRKFFSTRRSDAFGEERGSMAILMMVVLVGAMLSALLVPMIITQSRTTRFDTTRVQALDAAQSGIDVVLGAIRASVSNAVGSTVTYGDSGKLPCGTESGQVSGSSIAAYSVVVEYFTFDPLTEPYPSTLAMKCVPGYGTYDPASAVTTPKFARFTSTGTVGTASNGATAGRTLTATYVFRTSNVNILGGTISPPTPLNSAALCVDAGSATPVVGAPVTLQPCSPSSPLAARQVFAYRTDLTLQLVSSITAANPNGLCLNSASQPAASGDAVKLSLCGPLGSPTPYTEQWSFNDAGRYQAAVATSAANGTLSTLCMDVASQAVGQPIILTNGTCSPQDAKWLPSASVGPGAAALPQWVNYHEFGRCLDVTATWVDTPFLIDYPCKQNPYPAARNWNELFTAPPFPALASNVTGPIYTTPTAGGTKYCLTSPGTNGNYVTVKVCDGRTTQTWTIYNGDASLNYSTKYTIVSGSLCLGLGLPDPSTPSESAWSTIDVETCTGTAEQKWNASPNVLSPALKNIQEK